MEEPERPVESLRRQPDSAEPGGERAQKPREGNARVSTIRTMRSDVEELFRTTKPSLLDLMRREAPGAARQGERRKLSPFVLGVGIFFIAAAIALGTLLWVQTPKRETTPPLLTPPAPFFATERSRTISVDLKDRSQFLRLMEDSRNERERPGTIKRILIKVRDGPQERFASLADFFALYRITPPQAFLAQIDSPLMVFIYYSEEGSSPGFAARTRDPDRTLKNLLSWESSLSVDAKPLFGDLSLETLITPFEDRTYRNIDWRYLKLSPDRDAGIGYTVFPRGSILVVTTGKEVMETVISRLFDAR